MKPNAIRQSFSLLILLTILLGGVYPLLVMALSQTLFNHAANGSLIEKDGEVIGSELLGQQFDDPKYFWGRLSATTPPYNAAASAATNMNPANSKLLDAANVRIAALQKANPGNKERIPVDLVTASASGVDPDITRTAALYQVPRIAKARGMGEDVVLALVEDLASSRFSAMAAPTYVNVLRLNMALDKQPAAGR